MSLRRYPKIIVALSSQVGVCDDDDSPMDKSIVMERWTYPPGDRRIIVAKPPRSTNFIRAAARGLGPAAVRVTMGNK
jgi:hypothetical protein